MADCLIAFGSNLGDRKECIDRAVDHLSRMTRIDIQQISSVCETAPIGGPGEQGLFLNGAIRLSTDFEPDQLLDTLLATEKELGRERVVRWSPRNIDLDLLLYDDLVSQQDRLTVPHPRFLLRRFALEPAAEIAGQWVHPLTGWSLNKHVSHLNQSRNLLVVLAEEKEFLEKIISRLIQLRPGKYALWQNRKDEDCEQSTMIVTGNSAGEVDRADVVSAKLIVRVGMTPTIEQGSPIGTSGHRIPRRSPGVCVAMDAELDMPLFQINVHDVDSVVGEVDAAIDAIGQVGNSFGTSDGIPSD